MHDTDIQTPGSNGRPVPLGGVTHAASRGVFFIMVRRFAARGRGVFFIMVRRFAARAVASRAASSGATHAAVFTDIGLSIAADMRVCDFIADMYERHQDIRGDHAA